MTRTGRSPRAVGTALSVWVALAPALLPAATLSVAGRCSLGEAIRAANRDVAVGACPSGSGADTLELTGDVVLTTVDNPANGLPPVTSEIEIVGDGFSIRRADSAPRFRIFDVRRGGALTLESVIVANGSTAEKGGGIRSLGVLTLSNTIVSGNRSDNRGGGIYARGNDYRRRAEVTLVNSEVSQNSARRGAGIAAQTYTDLRISGSAISGNQAAARGGGVLLHDFARAAISNSTISSNEASSGAGVRASFYSDVDIFSSSISNNTSTKFEGGGIFSAGSDLRVDRTRLTGNSALRGGGMFSDSEHGEITVRSSTVSDNRAVESGGGIFIAGYAGSLSVLNSTISGNSAETGGGLFEISSYDLFDSDIRHSTISRNTAARGAGIYALNDDAQYHVLVASLVAGNEGGDCAGGGLRDGGGNFDGDGTCPGAFEITAGVDFDSELADNGGPTPTHALLEGSVAIDADDDCALATDQRLFARDQLCDSGSFEFDAKVLGASVTGIAPQKIFCKNLTTGSRGKTATGRPDWVCADLGVNARPPDRVLLWSIGTADGTSPVGGSARGLADQPGALVICRNRTNGEKVKFTSETSSWDCEAQGLVVAPGDSIQQKVKGEV